MGLKTRTGMYNTRTSLITHRDMLKMWILSLVLLNYLIGLVLVYVRLPYHLTSVSQVESLKIEPPKPTLEIPTVISSVVEEFEVEVTHYCSCYICCGKTNGITASGTKVRVGTAAADTKYWRPDLTTLEFFALPASERSFTLKGDDTVYVIEDVGGGIKSAKIDIYVPTHEEALEKGRFRTTLYKEVVTNVN